MKGFAAILFCLFLGTCNAEMPEYEQVFLDKYNAAINATLAAGVSRDELLSLGISSQSVGTGGVINCPSLPDSFKTNPTSVHKLTPYNIRVIGAVGDSVTAGFGALARNIIEDLIEFRGASWSIGGDKDVTQLVTLPNIIKTFDNPNIKGPSTGTGKSSRSNSHLNRAVSGARARDIPDQLRELVEKIKADECIRINEDWKMVTIWIGGNDLCAYCKDKEDLTDYYYTKMKESLDYLRDNLPRTFVNLVEIVDVSELTKLKPSGIPRIVCDLVHYYYCRCADGDPQPEEEARKLNVKLEELIATGDYEREDFAVVLQPFMKKLELPKNDPMRFFAPDCFHFSGTGHATAARSLWNNMMTPVGQKEETINWDEEPVFKCPTEEHPFFYTNTNSKQSVSSFGAVNPDDPNSLQDHPPNILGIVLGAGLTTFTVTMAIVVGVVAYARYRRRGVRSYTVAMSGGGEKTHLISNLKE